MPNIFFKARLQWKAGDKNAGFSTLNHYLESELKTKVFVATEQLLKSDLFNIFELAIMKMLTDNRILRASFSEVFSLLWQLNPSQFLLTVILNKNLYEETYYQLFDVFDDSSTVKDIELEFQKIIDTFIASALKGILSSDLSELPNGGRAVLSLQDIEGVPDSYWGSLKAKLLETLPQAFSACPPDFWRQLTVNEPRDVVTRFLHDLFLKYDYPLEEAECRWQVIMEQHIDYANAVCIALDNLLEQDYSLDMLTEIVHVDAGFTSVNDGYSWLKTLSLALNHGDFKNLASN